MLTLSDVSIDHKIFFDEFGEITCLGSVTVLSLCLAYCVILSKDKSQFGVIHLVF